MSRRIDLLDENQIVALIGGFEKDMQELKNRQFVGPKSVLANLITTPDAYDVQITHSATFQNNLLEYRFTADNQENPFTRFYLVAHDLSGKSVVISSDFETTTPPVHRWSMSQRNDARQQTWITLMEQAQSGTITLRYKAYVIASDTGKLELKNSA